MTDLTIIKTTKTVARRDLDDEYADAILADWFRQRYPEFRSAKIAVSWDVRGVSITATVEETS